MAKLPTVADLGGSGAGVETDQGEELLVWSRYYCCCFDWKGEPLTAGRVNCCSWLEPEAFVTEKKLLLLEGG